MDTDNVPTLQLDRDDAAGPVAAFALVVTEGPDAGKRFEIDPSAAQRVLVGLSPACDARLGDKTVSRRHLAVSVEGGLLAVEDLGSTNGTAVMAPHVVIRSARLDHGDVLRIGETTLRVERKASAAALPLPAQDRFGRLLGASREMRALYPLCVRLAHSSVPVVIEGETGTGKEVLAEALHEEGPRASGPFVVFDCTAVPANLLESELFGHEKGAFTGATSARKGVFEEADGGTLLIDEIGDLDLPLQAKLLRALERSEVRRVGANRPVKVDVRILAATRRDLDAAVQGGRFRDDLFHRLAVGRIELPPLRRRRGDVARLVAHFCSELGGDPRRLPADVLRAWQDSPWPGNVRELRNAVARHLVLGDLGARGQLRVTDPTEGEAREGGSDQANDDLVARVLALDLPLATARETLIREFEQRYLERVLAQHGGVVTRAAAASGIARRHFQRLRARARG